jgi:hypothetical protein
MLSRVNEVLTVPAKMAKMAIGRWKADVTDVTNATPPAGIAATSPG